MDHDNHFRENTMMSATAVFNLMSLACARSGHYKVVTDMFERSLRFCPKVSSFNLMRFINFVSQFFLS